MSQIVNFQAFAGTQTQNLPDRIHALVEQSIGLASGRRGQNTKHAWLNNEAFDLMDQYLETTTDPGQLCLLDIADLAGELYNANIYSEETGKRAVSLKNRVLAMITEMDTTPPEDGFINPRDYFLEKTGFSFSTIQKLGIGPQPEAELIDEEAIKPIDFRQP